MSVAAILFLDFDGVLHPVNGGSDQHFCRLPLLVDWLQHEAPRVRVVISSDWRLGANLEHLRLHFPPPLQSRIVGVLPSEAEVDPSPWADWALKHPRHCLILAWLAAHGDPSGSRWAALDDWSEGFRPEEHRLVRVDGARGLQPEHLDALSRIFEK